MQGPLDARRGDTPRPAKPTLDALEEAAAKSGLRVASVPGFEWAAAADKAAYLLGLESQMEVLDCAPSVF